MSPDTILGVVVQYGLPTVLLFAMAWWHARQQGKWETEREKLYVAWNEAVSARVDDAREYGTSINAASTKISEHTETVKKLTGEWERWQENDRARELRDVERENAKLRDTGSHQAPKLPPARRP